MTTKYPGDRSADHAIDALLRQHVRREDPGRNADCLDAEAVASWMDGALSPEERSRAEAHAAGCARCQATLAAMARTTPAAGPKRWWNGAAVRWLVPIAAAAVVFGVWMSTDKPQPRASQVAQSARAVEQQHAAAPVERTESAPDAVQTRDRSGAAKKVPFGGRPAPAPARKAERPDARQGAAAPQAVDALAPPTAASASAAPSSPPPAAAARAPAQSARTAAPAAPPSMQETVTVTSETPSAGLTRPLPLRDAVPFEVVSPEPAFRWRLGASGIVMRSTDGGRTWTSRSLAAAGAGLLPPLWTGASPSRDVCWIVGRLGAVWLTTDGYTWQLRPFPERVDLTSVRASDAKSAIVTAADGRQFATSDGGATWVQSPGRNP